MDLNSLYPSVIRALNMDPATIVGQLRPELTQAFVDDQMTLQKKSFAGAWEGKFGTIEYEAVMEKKKDVSLTVDFENGDSDILSGAEVLGKKIKFESGNTGNLLGNLLIMFI